jgi:two-component system OmpR family sensor kinase/two-component system phosphate regulon sensor histidine kinase PhoR
VGDSSTEKQVLSDSKTFFVNAVAHELFSPLSAVMGLLELVKEGDRVQENLAKMERHLNRMQRILEQLILLSKIEQENYQPFVRKIALEQVLREVIHEYEQRIAQKRISLSLEKTNVMIEADEEALKIVLRNLISNAVKYANEKSRVEIKRRGDLLLVRDEGLGIPEQELKNVTARFYRAKNVRSISGSGLGLAIVKHILRRLNITWAIHSKLNVGTTVFLELTGVDG